MAPVAIGLQVPTARPRFVSSSASDGRIRVCHREFLADVTGNPAFSVRLRAALNPALPGTFPWLSGLAQGFESYVFRSLNITYVPSVGTQHSGTVMMAVDYDARDPSPATKQDLMQMHGAVRTTVWDPVSLTCDPRDLTKFAQRYTRKTLAPTDPGDLKTYDTGFLLVAVEGADLTTSVGEIYMTYDVELITPQPVIFQPEAYAGQVLSDLAATGVTTVKPFGTMPEVSMGPIGQFTPATSIVEFTRQGEYLVNLIGNMTLAGGNPWSVTPNDVNAVQVVPFDTSIVGNVGRALFNVAVKKIPSYVSLAVNNAATGLGRSYSYWTPNDSLNPL